MDFFRDPIWQFLGVVVAVALAVIPFAYGYLKRRSRGVVVTSDVTRPTRIPTASELRESIVGQYVVLHTISETPLSVVQRVRSLGNGRTYILKQNKHPAGYDRAKTEEIRSLYQSETNRQLNVALPIEIIKEGDSLYELLEPVEGWTIEELVRLNPNRTVYGELLEAWAKELLDLLIPLHRAGYIHRDVSPYNIMVARDTLALVLIDFSSTVHELPHTNLSLIECPGFSAPELREGKYYPSSDLYSVGAVLAYLNTGHDPPTIEDRRYRGKEINLHDIRGVRLAVAIHKMLALEPEERFHDAIEAMAAIRRHGTTEAIEHFNRIPEDEFLLPDGSRLMIRLRSWRRVWDSS